MSALAAAAARRIEPEWLDTLPPEHPRARRSRADLVRVNALMGNASIVASALRQARPASVAEIGGGSGHFLAALAARCGFAHPLAAAIVDRHPVVEPATLDRLAARGWHTRAVEADVFDWLADGCTPRFDAIVANLFLHHFDDSALARLLELAARRARLVVACEPRRSGVGLAGAHLLALIGCNDVTRHDAVASVRAGFRDGEISAAWRAPGWTLEEDARGLFSHRFVARAP